MESVDSGRSGVRVGGRQITRRSGTFGTRDSGLGSRSSSVAPVENKAAVGAVRDRRADFDQSVSGRSRYGYGYRDGHYRDGRYGRSHYGRRGGFSFNLGLNFGFYRGYGYPYYSCYPTVYDYWYWPRNYCVRPPVYSVCDVYPVPVYDYAYSYYSGTPLYNYGYDGYVGPSYTDADNVGYSSANSTNGSSASANTTIYEDDVEIHYDAPPPSDRTNALPADTGYAAPTNTGSSPAFVDRAAAPVQELASPSPVAVSELESIQRAFVAGDFEGARQQVVRALMTNPDNADVKMSCALVYFGLRDYRTSAAALRRALELDPTFLEQPIALGPDVAGGDSLHQAITETEDYLKHAPNDGDAWLVLGYVKLAYGQRDAAAGAFERARQASPADTTVVSLYDLTR